MQKKGSSVSMLSALVIALLSLGGFVGAAAIVAGNQGALVFMASADEDEGDDGGDEGDDEEDKDDKDSDSGKKEKEQEREKEKKKSEETKKQAERERETEREHASNDQESDDDTEDDDQEGMDSDSDDDAEEMDGEGDEDGDNAMYRDRTKTMTKLAEKLAEAEKEILEKQAEGADVTAALARLAQAKAAAGAVSGAFDANNLESVKDLAKEARKLAHFSVNEDLHDAKKVVEDSAKAEKRIAQAEKKLAALKALGGDTAQFEPILAEIRARYEEAKRLIALGGADLVAGLSKLEAVEEHAKDLKDSIEQTLFVLGGEDDDFDDEHEDEIDDIADDLDDVADIEEDSVGQQVRMVAREQRQSAARVAALTQGVQDRSDVAEFLVGPKMDDIEDIQGEISMNTARIAVLTRAAEQVADQDVKSLLEKQIAELKAETAQLQGFVDAKLSDSGIFGWLLGMFR
jgi:hypothetical protein